MSQNWKNVKTSTKKIFFMNFSDIFMWVIVGENTFPGSVLDTISWSENSCGKKAPSFWTSHRFTHFLTNFLPSVDIFALLVNTCWPNFLSEKKATTFPYTTLTSKFSYVTWFLRYLHFRVRKPLDPI